MAAASGMRRNEMLALRWVDVDLSTGMVTVKRNVEDSAIHGRRVGTPKSARSIRTFQIDPSAIAMLKRERERHRRLVAGVPDGSEANASLVKLPSDALCFPAADSDDITRLRNPTSVSTSFGQHAAKAAFPGLTLHDVRASHGTVLLDNGVPVHTVAERLGHDAKTLLAHYARRTKRSDATRRPSSAGSWGACWKNWAKIDKHWAEQLR